ncbi:MAG: hypothetical protein J5379_07540 [Clostridiales bacterium]|nr:hypothetical protein [Clostridiales bacterium]
MFNVFRMHMYRTIKSRSTLVLGILLLAFIFTHLGLAYIVFEDPLNIQAGALFIRSTVATTKVEFTPDLVHMFFIQSNDTFIILLTIFAVLLTHSDFSKGFVKNTYGMFENKGKLVWSKWCAMVACSSIVYVAYSLLSLCLVAPLFKTFTSKYWEQYFREFFVVYICLIAMLTMVFLITSLFRSPAGGMVIGLIIASGLLQTLEKLVDIIIAKISGADLEQIMMSSLGIEEEGAEHFFRFSDYCLDNVYLSYSPSMGSSDTIRTVVVGLVYTAVALGLCILLARKRDVRC